MKKKSYKDLILVLIFQTSGRWSWYQVERELGIRGLGGRVSAVEIINQLIVQGFVIPERDTGKNLSIYWVTNAGKEKVKELITEKGAEFFERTLENRDDYE